METDFCFFRGIVPKVSCDIAIESALDIAMVIVISSSSIRYFYTELISPCVLKINKRLRKNRAQSVPS